MIFDPFSGDFSRMQRMTVNSVGLPYGVLWCVFKVVTVGKGAISLFR